DHRGWVTPCRSWVNARIPLPSAFITYTFVFGAPGGSAANAIRVPSGDQEGSPWKKWPVVSWLRPDPSVRIVEISCPPLPFTYATSPGSRGACGIGAADGWLCGCQGVG